MFLIQDHLENIFGLQRKRIKKKQKEKKEKKGIRIRKRKRKLPPPSAGPNFGPTRARPRFPSSLPGPGGPTRARRPPADTRAPPVSASAPSLSRRFQSLAARAHLSVSSPSPIPHRRIRRRAPPRLVALPLMLASLRDNPATVLEPTPHPPPARAIASALAPFPPSWRARRCSPSPPSPSLPRSPIKGPARAPSSPHSSGHPHCLLPRAVQASAAVLPSSLR
jgi:hypothetical protein